MAAKKKPTVNRQYCVLTVEKRGLDRTVMVYGPFSKAQAFAVAEFRRTEFNEECQVEFLSPVPDFMDWVLEDV